MRKIIIFIALLFVSFGLIACNQNSNQKITFETNQGTPIESIEFSNSYDITNLSQLSTSKNGYTFDGWFTNVSLDSSSAVTEDIKESITLYAKWNIVNYTITYYLDEGINASNNPTAFTILDNIPLEAATKTGYSFGGWYSDDSFTQEVTSIEAGTNANIDLYAKWDNLNYTITYHLDEGVNASNNPNTFTILDNITLESASKTGYSFGGWYSDDSFTQKVTSIEAGTNANIDLY
ncbi:MAG: InlB B-repeat-containing protein, partial [Bacilli bacterium]